MNREYHLWNIQCKIQSLFFEIFILFLTLPGLFNKFKSRIIFKKILKLFKLELFIILTIFASGNRVEFSRRWERAQGDGPQPLGVNRVLCSSAVCNVCSSVLSTAWSTSDRMPSGFDGASWGCWLACAGEYGGCYVCIAAAAESWRMCSMCIEHMRQLDALLGDDNE